MLTRRQARKIVVKRVDRGMLEGTGSTVTEAKADLNRQVDAALTGSYEPAIVSYGAYTAIVYREPSGWHYKMKEADEVAKLGIMHIRYGSHVSQTRDECIQSAASHVIDIGSGPDEIHQDSDIPAWLTDQHARRVILGNARFRRAYRHAEANKLGASESEWHSWGCDNSHDPRFA